MSDKEEVDQLADDAANLYLESYSFTTPAAIIGYLDKRVYINQTDDTNYIGTLRTFDQYGSIFLQDVIERVFLPNGEYGEQYIGMLFIRGENVLFMGEIDIDNEDDAVKNLNKVDFKFAKKEKLNLNKLYTDKFVLDSKVYSKFGLINEHCL